MTTQKQSEPRHKRLKRLRIQAGFVTQQELADEISVSRNSISNYERGLIDPGFTYEFFLREMVKANAAKLA